MHTTGVLLFIFSVCVFQSFSHLEIVRRSITPGEKSKEKCKEYSKYSNLEKKDATKEDCSFTESDLFSSVVPNEKQFPHMADLGYNTDNSTEKKWLCGGFLISEQFVLTNAYCLMSSYFGEVKYMKLGVTNRKNEENAQFFNVTERIYHPEYKNKQFYNDIALLKLDRPVELNLYVRPACLSTDPEVEEKQFVTTGWGSLEFAGEPENNLIKVGFHLNTTEECKSVYDNEGQQLRKLPNGIDGQTQVCATPFQGEQDICRGGAGGPLQFYNKEVPCTYSVYGMMSFGKACIATGTPTVFTKISTFVPWIESVVWP